MRRSSHSAGWAASRSTGGARTLLAASVLVLVLGLAAPAAGASCLDRFDPDIRALDLQVGRDATKALGDIDARIDVLKRDARPDARRLAELYAVQAQAYGILELDGPARRAATQGLALARDLADPVHLNLLSAYAENVYDAPDLARAEADIEAARGAQRRDSLADICLSITLGRVQYREDHSDLAVLNLMRAYRASRDAGLASQRVLAAWALAPVLRALGDFDQALALNQEVIDWQTRHDATLALSVARFLRGKIFSSMKRYPDAIAQFTEARALSVAVSDGQGIAFADLSLCEDETELGRLADARAHCGSALAAFAAAHSLDVVGEAQAYLARIDLAEGHADRALTRLDRVLEHGGREMPPRELPFVLELRARANAALGRYRQAFADLDEYARRYRAANDDDRLKTAAAERARFETDREIERNAALRHELASAHERSQRQRAELRWIIAASGAGGLVIALLTYVLVANLRYRRQLLYLAEQDALTGLPNRRRTAQLASAALAAASTAQRPLTIALIDLDRFKSINDRGGHAAGDNVLREFARVGRQCIRSDDILGRWGGEEFLLVLPETTLDTALASVDRLRALASAIELPEGCEELHVSFSAGLATSSADVRTLDDIVARADAALYEAKNGGRDLVRIAESSFLAASTGVRRALRAG